MSRGPNGTNTRSVAIADLFDSLEELIVAYQTVSETDRTQRWSTDADRITGEVARRLSTARARIGSTPR